MNKTKTIMVHRKDFILSVLGQSLKVLRMEPQGSERKTSGFCELFCNLLRNINRWV